MQGMGSVCLFCLLAVAAVVFVPTTSATSDAPIGAQCWACHYDDTDQACQERPRYVPPFGVDDNFCAHVRNSKAEAKSLCEVFADGYKILCHRSVEPRITRCRSQVCLIVPEKTEPHTGGNNSGVPLLQSRHAPGFLLVAMLVTVWTSSHVV